ncbi:LysR family transcriptional regulator [Burkholderia contaminans FFH2055]|uniref:LysR family transcriptional regulator n=1 Tax=Burkholderia contaminans TaxID=488447 RepID=A0A0G3Z5P4_9BURK|nr:LysR substrate-binding domain-containing protein [Burkholderia contaminans]TCW74019.1 LysR family transcriptional regulator [Burkholderia sp. SRS-25]AKM45068.1 LysR family transcriptional regulator [Burkholderia contaminans]AOL08727.1 LysR family transcriptional regulator [Burkholderia contaminans]ELK6464885.1 LysR family transcriptional regulator [Burkholderia contaminans]KKL35847.1 LysR family transcriptional regulator [Burkholderia contaminans FFH2055]
MANVRLAKRLRSMPSLDFLRGFECAARHLSFTRAGQELNVTQSAVSRQVKALEEQLRIELFHRHIRSLTLTDKGRELYDAISFALSDLESVIGKLSSSVGQRAISLSTTVSFAALWLIPRLGSFRASYPDIDVRVSATSEIEDLKRKRLHLAVRYAGPYTSTDETDVLFRERVVAVCSPSLMPAAGDAASMKPEDLDKHVLLHLDDPRGEWPWHGWSHLLKELGVPRLRPAGALHFSQYDQLVQAAVDGHGIAIGRRPLVDGLLKQGRLVELFPHCTVASGSYVLVQNPDACNEFDIAVLTNWLLEQANHPLASDQETGGSNVVPMYRVG